jgi:beta-glucosidase
VKHYAANNIEKGRDALIAKMDEQTLQEVYARHFGMIVQDGGVACVMAAYNLVDSTGTPLKSTQNKHLLTDILRTEFGFQGMVLSDWWAMPGATGPVSDPDKQTNSKGAIQAGMDMELPWQLNFPALAAQPSLAPDVKTSVTRVLETKWRFKVNAKTGARGLKAPAPGTTFDAGSYSVSNDAHLDLAEQAALEGTVLLKNDGVLPIAPTVKTVAVVGPSVAWNLQGTGASGTIKFAHDPRLGDLGSSRANADPAKAVGPCAGITAAAPMGVSVVCGEDADGLAKAGTADLVIVVAGLTPEDEGEEYTITPEDSDRGQSLALDGKHGGTAQNAYINSITALGKPTVVILEGGSVIDLSPFGAAAKGIVMAWYPGIRGGTALGKLLFGTKNFSGKLPITWPAKLTDEPTPFSGDGGNPQTTVMDYYLGYRRFDVKGIKPEFPFGYGLSYTKFEYSNLYVPCTTVPATGVVNVEVDVKNTGTVDGDETVFLFVQYPNSTVAKRVATYKELKGFQRASVPAGKAVRVKIPLRVSDLWYWDDANKKQAVAPGEVKVLVGGSAAAEDLTQMGSFTVM